MDFEDDGDFWKAALAISVSQQDDNKSKSKTDNENEEIPHVPIDNIKLLDSKIIAPFTNPIFVSRNGIYITVTGIDNQFIRKLCNKFTLKTKSNFGSKWNIARGFNIIKPDKSRIIIMLPRFGFLDYYFHTLVDDYKRQKDGTRKTQYADMQLLNKFFLMTAGNIVNQLSAFAPSPNISAIGLKLESHQTKIIDYIVNFHYNQRVTQLGYAGINLKLKTGAGKSYIAMGLIDRLKQPTLLVVHNQPQAEDMYDLTKKYFPNTSVGIYHSKEKILGQIMIMVIHSACGADEYTFPDEIIKDPITGKNVRKSQKFTVQEFFNKFGFVIFDESHKYCSPEFSKVYSRCQSMYMLGLSATPGERIDGFDPLTYWNVGQLVDIATIIPGLLQDEPFNTKVLGIKYCGSPEYTLYKSNNHGMFDNNATLIQMMEDPHRLHLIVQILEFLNENKRNVYIFSDRLEYLNIVRRELFDTLRKKHTSFKSLDTLDQEVMDFMKEKSDYKTYIQNVQNDVSKQWTSECKLWQDILIQASDQNFYNTKYAESVELIKLNEDVEEYSGKSPWYLSAFRRSSSFQTFVTLLPNIVTEKLKERQEFYNHVLKYETSEEYYNQLMETYRKEFIDDFIETKSSLSVLTGGASGEQISRSSAKATMIFTTYGYMGTGKSIPKMDTILFITPRRNGVEQVIGRIFRPGPNKNVRWIIDIIDWKINLKSQWYERLNVYEKQKDNKRNPVLCETEIDFSEIGQKNMQDTLSKTFDISKSSEMQSFTMKLSGLSLQTIDPPKRKIRILKKF